MFKKLILLGVTALLAMGAVSGGAQTYDNDELRSQIDTIGAVHNVAFAPSLAPEPITSIVAGSTTYSTNFGLKYIPPVLVPPSVVGSAPLAFDDCSYTFTINGAGSKVRQDYLAVLQDVEDDFSWSSFLTPPGNRPQAYHWNTDVAVTPYWNGQPLEGTVTLPVGNHTVRWEGQTLVTPILDFPPWHLLLAEVVEAASRKVVLGLKTPAARRAVMQGVVELFINLGIEGATFGLDWFVFDSVPTPASGWEVVNNRTQTVRIFDLTPPVFNVTVDQITVEATQVGGEYLRDHIATLRSGFTVTDTCERRPIVNYAGRGFMPVGEVTEITWTARDAGPVDINGGFNSRQFVQRVVVQDTLPPILLTPPGRVVESDVATALDIGRASVFDLADVRPSIANDAPTSFQPNTRTLVTWQAEDASGNATSKNQWITLKTPGSNTAPIASPGILSARTFEAIDIELTGIDNDLLSGRYDQLNFSITDQPDNGFFVAPLFPYFIEDYRIENEFGLSKPDLDVFLADQCAADPNNFVPPTDFVTDPRYITVDDEGLTYVIDQFLTCGKNDGKISRSNRISRFVEDAEGELQFEAQMATGSNSPDSLNIGANGFVYFKGTRVDSSTSVVRGCDALLTDCAVYRIATDTSVSNPDLLLPSAEPDAVAVTADNVMFVTDGRSALAAYDLEDVDNNFPALLGAVAKVGELTSRGAQRKDLAMDSQGNLYVSDYGLDRVYKFTASVIERRDDGSVEFTPGELIGWMGRCDTNNDPGVRACDEVAKTSYGYSCTDALCGIPEINGVLQTSGDAPGQFNQPQGIAINAKDTLYVTDHQNFRVQRFTPEGYFAGEAKSECDGSCFTLGDFGNPEDVSANTRFFYVLDRERDLLHVFETTPITDFDDDTLSPSQTARVTYQSDEGFTGTDSFGFAVTDGLATSNAATVTVNVTRNFRPPVATEGLKFDATEDASLDFTLRAFDPDSADQAGLVYTIETQPENGMITGVGPDFVYTPDPDYFGTETFAFSVSDPGGMVSETVEALIAVAGVNDLPVIALGEMQERYGAGFDIRLEATVNDVDLTDRHVYGIDWGPGESFRTGRALPPGAQPQPGQPTFIQAADGVGSLTHEATYFDTGLKTITVCMSDVPGLQALSDCDDPNVTARVTRNLQIDTTVRKVIVITDDAPTEPGELGTESVAPVVDGDTFNLLFAIHNLEPNDTGAVLDATAVELTAMLGDGLVVGASGVTGVSGNAEGVSCSAVDREISCTIERIPVAEQARIGVEVVGNGRIAEDRDVAVVAMVSSAEPDHADVAGSSRSYRITVDPDGDADGDGVLNRDDVFPGDPTESSDFDADGIGDNADRDDDGDNIDDAWETRFGLNGRDASDATGDADGDRLTNAEEFRRGTRPDSDDSDRDGTLDDVDNCPASVNRNQFDADSDGVGDACDVDNFATAAALGNVDGSGAPDFALVRTDAGMASAFIKDSADDESVAAVRIDLADPAVSSLKSVVAAAEGLASLAVGNDGTVRLALYDATSGAARFGVDILDSNWRPVALASAGTQLWVLALSEAGVAELFVYRSADGVAAGSVSLAGGFIPTDVVASADNGTAFVVGIDAASGEWRVDIRSVSDGSGLAPVVAGDGDTLVTRIAALASGFVTAAQSLSGDITVTAWDAAGQPLRTFSVLTTGHTLLDLMALPSASVGDAIAVAALGPDGAALIEVLDVADGSLLASRLFGQAGDSVRAQLVSAGSPTSDVGLLLANSLNEVTLELQLAEGADSNTRFLTAESSVAPPPPPPPPPGGGSGGGGGGGGAAGGLLIIAMSLTVSLRRRRRALDCRSEPRPVVAAAVFRLRTFHDGRRGRTAYYSE